jgi:hypothetical protein
MKTVQEISEFVKETTDSVVDAFKRQVTQFVRVLTKQQKKPPLSWETIIGDNFPEKTHRREFARSDLAPELPEIKQQLAELPQEIFDELLRRIQKNIIDEIQAIRLYEKLFDCEVQIVRGHVHFYKCTHDKTEETIDYTMIISRLIQLFTEHQDTVSRRARVSA